MRRSLAPSQRGKIPLKGICSDSKLVAGAAQNIDREEASTTTTTTISRLPLFGFLEIPEKLNQQFRVPSGCVITKQSIELRKTKRLGRPNRFNIVRPGDNTNLLKPVQLQPSPDDNDAAADDDLEQLPTAAASLPPFEPLILWQDSALPENNVEVIPQLASKLRPHQREGVQFLFECTMGLRGFDGQGCILADDMGLGKTLMSITILWTLMNQGFLLPKGAAHCQEDRRNASATGVQGGHILHYAVRKVMVVCPTSLVGNWDNELRKWIGDHVPTFAVKGEPKKMIKSFLMHRGKGVLIVSYETQRLYSKLFENAIKQQQCRGVDGVEPSIDNAHSLAQRFHSDNSVCDLLICDEAHKLKNAESNLAKSLELLPAKKRILLSGTPMQNDLSEFFNMVNFCNPLVLGTHAQFRKRYERPILASREMDASPEQVQRAAELQKELSTIVNEFILKRGNILNAQHLPPKLVQFVCCRLTPLQEKLYRQLLSSKEISHIREGKQFNTLNHIRQLINICSHPQLVLDAYEEKLRCRETVDDSLAQLVSLIPQPQAIAAQLGTNSSVKLATRNPVTTAMKPFKNKSTCNFDPELSGKMSVLLRLMQTMRAVQQAERIVIVSNYTQTLDLIERMCLQCSWPALRLDGTIGAQKRTRLVDEFNNPHSNAFAFLLSSKAGGCGINLIGGNRLVLFDPDWNPASDKQAAARIWREGQKRRCFIYRFMSTGTIEEKIIQRQLSKEGLVDIVENKEQINVFSSDDLRQLFALRCSETRSDTHDTLRCQRCSSVRVKQLQNNQMHGMAEAQIDRCIEFIEEFKKFLTHTAHIYNRKQLADEYKAPDQEYTEGISPLLPFHEYFDELAARLAACKELNPSGKLVEGAGGAKESMTLTLPGLSKELRSMMTRIEEQEREAHRSTGLHDKENIIGHECGNKTYDQQVGNAEKREVAAMGNHMNPLFPGTFSVVTEFINQWTQLVPTLIQLKDSSANERNIKDDIEVTGDEEFVEQDGCPEETDFNKWSHHCTVNSCDDDIFRRALADDNTVSFVFGLEVNWSLLEAKEAATREENEARKERQRIELQELNARRQREKEASSIGKEDGASASSDSSVVSGTDGDVVDKQKHTTLSKDAEDEELKGEVNAHSKSDSAPGKFRDSGRNKRKDVHKSIEEERIKRKKKKMTSKTAPCNHIGNVKSSGAAVLEEVKRVVSTQQKRVARRIQRTIDPLTELDPSFQMSWMHLKRQHSRKRVQFDSFESIWKALKNFDNNWRSIIDPAMDRPIFTRVPGLKPSVDLDDHYLDGYDFFCGRDAFKKFIVAQARLNGDGHLFSNEHTNSICEVIDLLTAPDIAVPAEQKADERNKLISRDKGSGSADSKAHMSDEEYDFEIDSAPQRLNRGNRRNVIDDSSDESYDNNHKPSDGARDADGDFKVIGMPREYPNYIFDATQSPSQNHDKNNLHRLKKSDLENRDSCERGFDNKTINGSSAQSTVPNCCDYAATAHELSGKEGGASSTNSTSATLLEENPGTTQGSRISVEEHFGQRSDEWACTLCTFVNCHSTHSNRCKMCRNPRSKVSSRRRYTATPFC